ncbi:MAG: response regulator [Planctomycetota bacterium]
MQNLRPHSLHSDPDAGLKPRPGSRLNVLLTEDRRRPVEHWTRQFPRLMRPLGVEAHLAGSAREALDLADRHTFHAALVDLATPVGDAATTSQPADRGGLWLLQVLRRRPNRPPVVVVNSRATRRQADRLLREALQLGAFSVVNRPDDLRPLLAAVQRLVNRHYHGQWPSPN